MSAMASQITSLTLVYSTVYSGADQRKHQSSSSLAFVWGIHRDRWIPRTKGQLRGKRFHLMTSSWLYKILWEPLWKGQGCLTKVAIFDPFPFTILYKSCLFHLCISPSWQTTSFERPPSWVAFLEGFHCVLCKTVVVPFLIYWSSPQFCTKPLICFTGLIS